MRDHLDPARARGAAMSLRDLTARADRLRTFVRAAFEDTEMGRLRPPGEKRRPLVEGGGVQIVSG